MSKKTEEIEQTQQQEAQEAVEQLKVAEKTSPAPLVELKKNGYVILKAETREQLLEDARKFLASETKAYPAGATNHNTAEGYYFLMIKLKEE